MAAWTILLYLASAALTAWGSGRPGGSLPPVMGGLLWAAGTVSALVEGAGLDEVLIVTLAPLLVSTGFWRRAER